VKDPTWDKQGKGKEILLNRGRGKREPLKLLSWQDAPERGDHILSGTQEKKAHLNPEEKRETAGPFANLSPAAIWKPIIEVTQKRSTTQLKKGRRREKKANKAEECLLQRSD